MRAGVDADLFGRAVEIAGRAAPLLAFTAVHRQLHCVAVGALESFVAMKERLNPVFAGFDLGEIADWIAKGGLVHRLCFAGFPRVDVDAEDLLRR